MHTQTDVSRRNFFTKSATLATAPFLLSSLFSTSNASEQERLKVPTWKALLSIQMLMDFPPYMKRVL